MSTTTKITQFQDGGITRNTDIFATVRNGVNTKSTLQTGLQDNVGNYLIGWTSVGGLSVNYVNFTNAEVGDAPVIQSATNGVNLNVPLWIISQGTANIELVPGVSGNLVVDSTTQIGLPAGTTAQRPAGVIGGFRINRTEDQPEYWSEGTAQWEQISGSGGQGNLTSSFLLGGM